MSSYPNQRIESVYKQCEELIDFDNLSWWIIDLEDNPNIFYCNHAMCKAFQLDPNLVGHSVNNTCPIAGDYNQNIAIRNTDQAKQIFEEYSALRHGKIDEYSNRFPYYDEKKDETFYYSSRARALKTDTEGNATLLLGIIEPEIASSELYLQAKTDSLTGLYNRREFDSQLNFFINLARREKQQVTLLICDIDYFKSYNDTYGHYAGDICLSEVALSISHACERSTDLVFRYGGEEFAAILYGDDLNLEKIVEGIRREIQAMSIPHKSVDHRVVTLSVGYASILPEGNSTSENLINYADQALYHAKNSGRNICSRYNTSTNVIEHVPSV